MPSCICKGLPDPEFNVDCLIHGHINQVNPMSLTSDILRKVQRESERAHRKHGDGSILSGNRGIYYIIACAMEELGEVARAYVDGESPERIIEELIQTANVALSGAQAINDFHMVERCTSTHGVHNGDYIETVSCIRKNNHNGKHCASIFGIETEWVS